MDTKMTDYIIEQFCSIISDNKVSNTSDTNDMRIRLCKKIIEDASLTQQQREGIVIRLTTDEFYNLYTKALSKYDDTNKLASAEVCVCNVVAILKSRNTQTEYVNIMTNPKVEKLMKNVKLFRDGQRQINDMDDQTDIELVNVKSAFKKLELGLIKSMNILKKELVPKISNDDAKILSLLEPYKNHMTIKCLKMFDDYQRNYTACMEELSKMGVTFDKNDKDEIMVINRKPACFFVQYPLMMCLQFAQYNPFVKYDLSEDTWYNFATVMAYLGFELQEPGTWIKIPDTERVRYYKRNSINNSKEYTHSADTC